MTFESCKARENLDFYSRLEQARGEFEDGRQTTFHHFQLTIKRWIALLSSDDRPFSSGRRSVRGRARRILTSVDQTIGSDLSILCMRCITIDRLAKIQEAGLLQDLSSWWNAASHPPALVDAALQIRRDFPAARLAGVPPVARKLVTIESSGNASLVNMDFRAFLAFLQTEVLPKNDSITIECPFNQGNTRAAEIRLQDPPEEWMKFEMSYGIVIKAIRFLLSTDNLNDKVGTDVGS